MPTHGDEDLEMSGFWKHAAAVFNPTTIAAILVQTVILVWWLSSFKTETQFEIADLTRRMVSVEQNQIIAGTRYSEIKEQLGRIGGQNESILIMLRDLQADRRMAPRSGPP